VTRILGLTADTWCIATSSTDKMRRKCIVRGRFGVLACVVFFILALLLLGRIVFLILALLFFFFGGWRLL